MKKSLKNSLRGLALGLAMVLCLGSPALAGVAAYWTFDDSNALEYDSVDTSNGASNNGVAYYAGGMFGGASDYGTTDDSNYILLTQTSDFNNTLGLAFTCWYNSNGNEAVAAGEKLFHTYAGSMGTAMTLSQHAENYGYVQAFNRDADRDMAEATGTTGVHDSVWHNISYVYDAAAQTTYSYLDGILDSSAYNADIGAVSGFPSGDFGRIGMHAGNMQPLGGLLDDMTVSNTPRTAQDIALINGLGRFVAVSMADHDEIAAVEAAFEAGVGNSATAGGSLWNYASGLGSTTIGTTGGTTAGGDAYIVLDAAGNGVMIDEAPLPPVPGDANGDRTVDADDAARLAANWLAGPGATWGMGNFNGDGYVNDIDATIMAANWGYSDPQSVPEPGTLALLLAGMVTVFIIRRR